MPEVPNFDESELLYFTQSVALFLCKKYCCAACYHENGIATKLHMVQTPSHETNDRFAVICTECGENVANSNVGRISIWFLTKQGQDFIFRAKEIKLLRRRIEDERKREAGTYEFDPAAAIKELGF